MLKRLREKKVARMIWIALAVLILPAFVLWGMGSMMGQSGKAGPAEAGRIFSKNITSLEYREAYLATRTQFMIQMGDEFSKLEKYLNLKDRTWDRIILLYEARKKGIKVSDKEVSEMIQKYPFFQSSGSFDYDTYQKIIQYYFGTQPRLFEEQTRDTLIITKLFENLASGVTVTPEEAKNEYRKENEQISVYYIGANAADFTAQVVADQEQIKDYFNMNAIQFKKPDSFNLEYIGIEYPQPQDEKNTDTKPIDDKIKGIVERLNKEKDLAKIAKELSIEIKETGLFGLNEPIPGIGWSPEIVSNISKLNIGSFAPPIHTQKGWYIVKLKEKKASYVPTLEEAKDKVKDKISQIKSREIAKGKIESALAQLKVIPAQAKAADFDKIAKALGLKSASSELFKRAAYIQGLGASDKFFDEAQKLGKDKISAILETDQGFYIIMLKEAVSVDEEKFTKEEKEFTQALLRRKQEDHFAKFLEELRKKAQIQDNISDLINTQQ